MVLTIFDLNSDSASLGVEYNISVVIMASA